MGGHLSDKLAVRDITDKKEESPEAQQQKNYAGDQIGPGKKVSMHFSLGLTNHEIVDSNFGGQAATFEVGDGNLLAGFESVIFGLRPGQKQTFTLAPEKAFGVIKKDNIHPYPRYQFPADLSMQKGLMLSFTDAANNAQAGVIIDFDADKVMVDFNHPLAGREIVFRVEILAVEPKKRPKSK